MRRILAVTSGRADASPMAPVMKALKGLCDGQSHDFEIPSDATPTERLACYATGTERSILDYMPNIVLLLGDRYETLGAASAAMLCGVPIAHIHGGEASFGSFDNQTRDAITKLSHVHFVAHEEAFFRLRDYLDEDGHRIHVVGAPGLDNIAPILAEERPESTSKYFVVTYHTATLGDDRGAAAMIEALARFPDYSVMWTGVNADPGAGYVYQTLQRAFGGVTVMSADGYLRAVRDCAAVVGNSSSGLIEAPALEVPTVNIGTRQEGRPSGPSVYHCAENPDAIEMAIGQALVIGQELVYEGKFTNPYGGPGASAKIAKVLSEIDLDGIMVKR